MQYPIFKSIVNSIELQLEKRGINPKGFKVWENTKINATGLEIDIGLENTSEFIKSLCINFDWDSFRETNTAKNLVGMESHPFLKVESLVESEIKPSIDIEMSWKFNTDICQPIINGESGHYRVEKAGKWMEEISKKVNTLLFNDDIITRWHIEIEGDEMGKYLSSINLISYFQFDLDEPQSVNDVYNFVSSKVNELLLKANKVIFLSDHIVKDSVAA